MRWNHLKIVQLTARMTLGIVVFSLSLLIQELCAEESTVATGSTTTPNVALTNEVKGQYEAITTVMLDSLRRAHLGEEKAFSSASKRGRRDRGRNQKQVHDERGVYRLTSLDPLYPLCKHSRHVSILNWKAETYALCISAQGFATLGKLGSSGWSSLRTWTEPKAAHSVLFHFNEVLYAVIADPFRANGSELLRWNADTNRMEIDHIIHSRFATAITIWQMNSDQGNYHLAIANSKGPKSDISSDYTYTYDWRGAYFDQYDSVRSYDVSDLEAFHIHGQAYLAVGNRRTDNKNFNAVSEIFRFDLGDWRWRSFQKISTRAVTDIQFFEMGPERAKDFFLVMANQFEIVDGHRNNAIDSVIYKFVDGRFVPFQCIPTQGASSLSAFTDPESGAFLLTIGNLYAPVQIYQYDGWNFVQTQVQSSGESMGPGASAITFYTMAGFQADHQQMAIVISNPKKETAVNVFTLSFVHEAPLRDWYKEGLDWCNQGHDRLNDTLTPELVDTMKIAYFIDQEEPIVINGPVSFQRGLDVAGTLLTQKVTNLATGDILDHSLLLQLQDLNNRLQFVKDRIQKLKSILDRAVKTSGTQTITGNFEFSSFSCSCGSIGCQVEKVRTVEVNKYNVDGLSSKIVFLNAPNQVLGPLDFESLHVEGDVLVTGLVHGVNTSHIVARNTNRKIIAQKTFEHTVAVTNIDVQGMIDNVQISPETILLTEGDQHVQAEMTMTEIVVQDIEIEGTTNGVNLHQFYEDVVLVDGGVQLVTGPKILKGTYTFENLHLESGKINGVDLVDLWTNAVWLDEEQTISAPANFSILNLVNPKTAHINNEQIPGPEIVSPGSTPLHVPAHQRFWGDVIIDKLDVDESINGLGRVPGKPGDCPDQLDILLRSCDQTLTGSNTFVSVSLGGSSRVSGTFNGFDLTHITNHLKHNSQNLTGDWVFNQVELHAPVLVREDLSGWEAENIYRRALKLGQPLPPNADVIFTGPVEVERLVCPDVNGINVEQDLLLRRGNGVVTGAKHWEHLVLLDNAKVKGLVNGVNINFLGDTLLNGPYQQVLQGHRVINGDLVVTELNLEGLLSGLDLNRLIPLNSEVTLHNTLVLDNVRVGNGMRVSNMAVLGGRVNKVNLGQVLNDTLLYNSPQKIAGRKVITGQVTIPTDSEFNVAFVNGISLSSLAKDTVYKNVPQQITGKKTFTAPTHFDNLIMNGSFNGVSIWEIFNDWMLQDVPQTILGEVVFNNGLNVDGDVTVSGLVNRIDIAAFKEDMINVNEAFEITGDLKLNAADVAGHVTLTGKIQGIDLSSEAASKFADNVISGRKHFRNILIEGDLKVGPDLNGVNVEEMCRATARRTGDVVLDHVVVKGNVRIVGDLITNGIVNGQNLDTFARSIVLLDQRANFQNVNFKELVIQQDVVLHGSMNGANLAHLESTYMSITKPQEIASKTTFNAPVIYEGVVHVQQLVSAGGMIGDFNVTDFAMTALSTQGQQVVTAKYVIQGNLYFDQELHVSSPISGVQVPSDLALKSRDNVISGPLIFANDLTVTSDIFLSDGATLQGVDVSLWAENTVMATGDFTLTGLKTFQDLVVQDVFALGLLGATNISSTSILLASGSQVATGRVLFGNSMQVDGSLEAMSEINGVNIPRLLTDSVLQSRPSVITAHKVFIAPLTVSRLTIRGFVSGVNVTELSILSRRPYDLEVIETDLQSQGKTLEIFDLFLDNGPKRLSFYSEWFRWTDDRNEVLAWDYFHVEGLAEGLIVSWRQPGSPTCTKTTVYHFQDEGLVTILDVPSSFAISVKTFSFFGTSYLAVANVNKHCNPAAGGIQVFSMHPTTGTFVLKQELSKESSTAIAPLNGSGSLPCLASAIMNKVLVHCLDKQTQEFNLGQVLNIPGVIMVSFLECQDGIFLSALAFQDGAWRVHIFIWEGETLVPLQEVPAIQPLTSPLLISHTGVTGAPICLLIVSEGSLHDKKYVHPSSIYKYDSASRRFLLHHELDIGNIVSAQWTALPHGDLLLSLLTPNSVHTLVWKGHAGFTPYDQVTFHGGKNLLAFTRENSGSISHYVAVSGRLCATHWWETEVNTAFLLKATVKGT